MKRMVSKEILELHQWGFEVTKKLGLMKLQPAKTVVSPRSKPLGTFREFPSGDE